MATRKIKELDTTEAPPAAKKPRRAAAPKAAVVTAAAPAPVAAAKPAAPKRARKPKIEADMVPAQASVMHHEERHRHVSEAAYYLAERRGFAPGFEHEDWVRAEAEVAAKLKG
ncbi:MAG: DUF2934 domain-containing protein [Rhodocyclaceae bacterium]|nr:DUF2934 domain-containing protein [Rhodocyclaceae bacterium]